MTVAATAINSTEPSPGIEAAHTQEGGPGMCFLDGYAGGGLCLWGQQTDEAERLESALIIADSSEKTGGSGKRREVGPNSLTLVEPLGMKGHMNLEIFEPCYQEQLSLFHLVQG